MKKGLVVLSVLALLIVASAWAFSQYSTGEGERAGIFDATGNVVADFDGEKVELKSQNVDFEFEGYSPVKSHIGTFDDWSGELYLDGDKIEGVKVRINASSVNTNISRLDNHLRSDDFFDVAKYPEITFISTEINSKNSQITGNLLFRGVTKQITFLYTEDKKGLHAEFFLDTNPFSFKYTGVNKEVRLKIDFKE